MITLFHYVDGINGSLVSVIDYYNMMTSVGMDVKLALVCDTKSLPVVIRQLSGSHNLQKYLNVIQLTDKVEDEIIICSSAFFFKDTNITLEYDRLFVFDSLELSKMKHGFIGGVDLPNATYLCNPCNFMNDLDCVEYYHKIDFTRNTCVDDVYVYQRQDKPAIQVDTGKYIENINKTLFEHLYHGKSVDYGCGGKFMDDGLSYYLRLIGVDDSYGQTIKDVDVGFMEFNVNDKLVELVYDN